jgi:hypothetical protein
LTSYKTDFHSSLRRDFPLQPLLLIFLRSSSTFFSPCSLAEMTDVSGPHNPDDVDSKHI